jgi:hypothetical protein
MNRRVFDICQKMAVRDKCLSRRACGGSRITVKPFPLPRGRRHGDRQHRCRAKFAGNFALRRKKWLFFGSDNGARTAAILTSFLAACKRLQISPFTYVPDIFQRIIPHPAKRFGELLSDNWASRSNRQPKPSRLISRIPRGVPDYTCVYRTATYNGAGCCGSGDLVLGR